MESSPERTGRRGGVDASLTLDRGGAWAVGLSLGAVALGCILALDYLIQDLSYRRLLSKGKDVAYGLAFIHPRLFDVGVAMAAVMVPSMIAWLVWQYAAHATVFRLGIERTRFKPALGVGVWFIPGANLVLSFLAMREIWRASDPESGPTDWRARRTPLLLWVWWILFVAAVSLAILGIRSELGPRVLNHQLIVRDRLLIPACWVGIATVGLAGILVKQVNDRLFVRAHRAPHGVWTGRR